MTATKLIIPRPRPRLQRPQLGIVPTHGPRVAMRPAGGHYSDRTRARARLVALYASLMVVSLLAYATRPQTAEAEPLTAPIVRVVGEHTFILATPTATPEPGHQETVSRLWRGFSPSVLYWESLIIKWSDHYGMDPNKAAVVMQIESCGDPQAVSYAGARGLFQVMPFHFAAGEDAFDPDTNAMRGLGFFAEVLAKAGGDVSRAFAAYNGGWGGTAGGWDTWKHETQRYFLWSTGIYTELHAGPESETLGQWLRAGGASLCAQAEARLAAAVAR